MADTGNPILGDAEHAIVSNVRLVSVDPVTEHDGGVLLGRRENEPAKCEWFVPRETVFKDESRTDAAVVVESVTRETATDTGVVTVDADDNRVIDIIEKPAEPPSTLATTGCYIATPELFETLRLLRPSARGEYELPDGIGVLIRAGVDVLALRSKHRRVNVNEPSDIDRAEAILETSPEQTTARSLIDTRALPS